MPRRTSNFARALSDAKKRLDKALAEHDQAELRIKELNKEIPRLRNTVAALLDQVDPVLPSEASPKLDEVVLPKNLTPEELARWYTERPLAGVSSIPPGGEKPAAKQLSEDELLPDELPGKPVLEK